MLSKELQRTINSVKTRKENLRRIAKENIEKQKLVWYYIRITLKAGDLIVLHYNFYKIRKKW